MIRILIFILFSFPLVAQEIDTTTVFSLDDYLTWVRAYHPVMQQAGLLEKKSDAMLLEARGAFDPKWFGEYEDKSFDQKNYFQVGEAGLKVPVWFGANVKAGYLWSNGEFLNPEGKLPQMGQALVGVELPLLRGLLFDQRRAQVKQARLFRDVNEATRQNIVNELLIKAIETYWNWAYQYQVLKIYENSLDFAEQRFEFITESYKQGDKPAIDTLETKIQVQNRNLQLKEATVDFQNASLELSNYLWYEDLIPLEVSSNLRPESLENLWSPEVLSQDFFDKLSLTHPQLQNIILKQQQLDIKEQLKKEQFKPDLKLNYNFLATGLDFANGDSESSVINNIITENYKWGVNFNYPLFLRKERAGLELVQLEQLETMVKLKDKELQITNKIKALFQQITTTLDQLDIVKSMVVNYEILLSAENEKFRFGESSIFLINSREQKLIEAQIKLNKLQVDFQKLRWKLDWAKGVLE